MRSDRRQPSGDNGRVRESWDSPDALQHTGRGATKARGQDTTDGGN